MTLRQARTVITAIGGPPTALGVVIALTLDPGAWNMAIGCGLAWLYGLFIVGVLWRVAGLDKRGRLRRDLTGRL